MSEPRNNRLPFVDWLRCCSMVSIVACHMVQIPYSKVSFLAQIFNLGVQIFFVVSGFSLGIQGCITDIKKWYIRRFRKIFIPYELFLIVLFIAYWIKPFYLKQLNLNIVVANVFGMQGFFKGLLGATHTWFITSILIFYAVLPLFAKIWFRLKEDRVKRMFFLAVHFILFVLTYLLLDQKFSVIIAPVFMAIIAYTLGTEYKKEIYVKTKLISYILLLCMGLAIRFLCSYLSLNRLTSLIVASSTFCIAFAVFLIFAVVFKYDKGNRIIGFLTGISFEIYLYHNIFIEGPIYLMYKTDIIALNILITVTATVISAFLANKVVGFLNYNRILRKKGFNL